MILIIFSPTALLNTKYDASGTSFVRPVGKRMSHADVALVTCWREGWCKWTYRRERLSNCEETYFLIGICLKWNQKARSDTGSLDQSLQIPLISSKHTNSGRNTSETQVSVTPDDFFYTKCLELCVFVASCSWFNQWNQRQQRQHTPAAFRWR